MSISELKDWLNQPDARDIVPVRGIVMRTAAAEIERLEEENARLQVEATAASEPPARITFTDGSIERELVWDGSTYVLPEGADSLDDIREPKGDASDRQADDTQTASDAQEDGSETDGGETDGGLETSAQATDAAAVGDDDEAKADDGHDSSLTAHSGAYDARKTSSQADGVAPAEEQQTTESTKGEAQSGNQDDEAFELPSEWQ